ncbi:chitin synthase-domain-containing protein [Pisolithus tinctorius]|nr:chitin synthase-domain-containing protein [Pisolithus tinctorius]
MIATVYSLEALVFILCHKWDIDGWMDFYILAIPIFSFMLPIYSFWCMDNFSWGAMHVVLGESGKKIIIHDEGKFDPHSIPLKTWNDYENQLWDQESNHSIGSWVPPTQFCKEGYTESCTASLYNHETFYEPHTQSPTPLQFCILLAAKLEYYLNRHSQDPPTLSGYLDDDLCHVNLAMAMDKITAETESLKPSLLAEAHHHPDWLQWEDRIREELVML